MSLDFFSSWRTRSTVIEASSSTWRASSTSSAWAGAAATISATIQVIGDHLRSGGSVISVVPENPRPGSTEAAAKAPPDGHTLLLVAAIIDFNRKQF